MTRRDIRNHLRNEERIELRTNRIFSLCITHHLIFECLDTTNTGSEDNPDTVLIFRFQVHCRVGNRLLCRTNGQQTITITFAGFLAIYVQRGIEVLYFARKLCLKLTCIEMSNRSRATSSVDKTLPCFCEGVTKGRNSTKTCYYYSFQFHTLRIKNKIDYALTFASI